MKTKLCQLNFPFVLVLFVSCLAQQVLGSQSVSISIIWDRHSDGRPHWSTFRVQARGSPRRLHPVVRGSDLFDECSLPPLVSIAS